MAHKDTFEGKDKSYVIFISHFSRILCFNVVHSDDAITVEVT